MVGSGDRSEKIRTYNFKDNRITDHRIGYTVHQLDTFMEGDIGNLIDALVAHYQAEKLQAGSEAVFTREQVGGPPLRWCERVHTEPRLCDHAQRALAADEELGEVGAGRLPRSPPARAHDLTVGSRHL